MVKSPSNNEVPPKVMEGPGLNAGVSLKPQHYDRVLEGSVEPKWFEVHTENYMGDGGLPHHYLEQINEKFPLSFHGVGLSLGSAKRGQKSGLDKTHLKRIKTLVDRYNPALVSEHVAWSLVETEGGNVFHNDLLPVPYTKPALAVLVDNINEMQDYIGRHILIENPSTYLTFKKSDYSEADFILEALHQTGAGMLLDVNNVYVSAENHGWDAAAYLNKFPADIIGEVHMAGHHVRDYNGKTIRIDDHGSEVIDDVWALFDNLIARVGPKPTLIEWDTDVPAFDVLEIEVGIAQTILNKYRIPHEENDYQERGVCHG